MLELRDSGCLNLVWIAMRSKEAASGRFCRCCRLHIFDSLSLFLCSICTIARIISTVKRWVLIILWRFCEALILRASQRFFTCFRTRFSWFDHIFTTNLRKNIFVWFSYYTSPAISYFLTKFCTLFHSFLTVLYTFHTPVQSLFFAYSVVSPSWFEKTMSKWYKLL